MNWFGPHISTVLKPLGYLIPECVRSGFHPGKKKKMEILRSPNWLLKMRYLNSFGRQMSNVQLNYSSNSIVTCKPALKRKMSSNN